MEPYIIDKAGRERYEFSPLGRPCQYPDCERGAVLNQCNAHGFPYVTHPHGGIHPLDGTKHVKDYCEEHGKVIQKQNDQVIRLNKHLAKKGWR